MSNTTGEKDANLVAYCGLYCGECSSYKGKIADLARDLRKELRAAKFERVAEAIPFKEFRTYRECYETLGVMVRLRCKKACRGGGGNPYCTIRKCCTKKGMDGCWQCNDFESCEKLASLTPIHGDEHIKNLRKISKKGMEEFVK